ncbi:MAG: Phosphoheptose isomerase 1 [Alphaproteobacteria bacterium MarineAlpha5_Bin11]|nr:phosphoheptose isomerase [Pelagibacteraceae bacterium]PPR43281.1 MAG: Phosphoheptose isomerase 1 [Alphaproteobacteria bacterium MarineAlpha5_Bin11]PPR51281.1 MAG: Phosphoheptose isomerase 1 [Alphaproteobacteria bacterium MarineAlpha5_Bin10]|tara:strand:+ start:23486 stop:24079 length:594 start_codon:yes stop_codon:yes gene_type:complete
MSEKDKIENLLNKYFDESILTFHTLKNNISTIKRMALEIHQSQINGSKLLIGGNGGSAADAQHFAGELTCTYKKPDRRPYSAISLSSNASAITAWANDFGYDSYFSRQVEAYGKSGDILFLISTGGGEKDGFSSNLVQAGEKGINLGLKLFSLVGKTGGELSKISHEHVKVDSFTTSHIQEAHITIIHSICEILESI